MHVAKENTKKITVKTMNKRELEMVMGWADREGWNPGKYDHIAFYEFDNQGHFLLELAGKPIGAISVVTYSDQFSFIGLFIVVPEYRSKGYGKLLWQHAMEYIKDRKTIGLYSVPKQISRYEAAEFRKAYRNHRWSLTPPHVSKLSNSPATTQSSHQSKQLFQYDQSVFGHNREGLLNKILSQPQTYSFVFFDEQQVVCGYGIVRACNRGFRIGPLYADNFENAKKICEQLLKEVKKIPGEQLIQVIFDIPTINTFEQCFAEYFNLEHIPSQDTVAMFKGEAPKESHQEKCYGTLALEVG